MYTASKDFAYNSTHNIRAKGKLVPKRKSGKVTNEELLSTMKDGFKKINSRIDNIVTVNDLKE